MGIENKSTIEGEEISGYYWNNEIDKVVVDGETLLITTKDGRELETALGNLTLADLVNEQNNFGFVLPEGGYEIKPTNGFNWGGLLINFLPLLIFGFLLFLLFRQARGANNQAMSFGRSRARLFPASRTTVTFNDVAGVESRVSPE